MVGQTRDQRGKVIQEDERRGNDGETKRQKLKSDGEDVKVRKKKVVQQVMNVQNDGGHPEDPFISFSKVDYKGVQPHQDDSMVISVVAADYKVERVLVDQGSSVDVLFWTTFQKLGKMEEELEACPGTFIDFAEE
ncbi:hypothetical protein CR513_32165, partial [Mucuna pruriens]